MHCTCTISLIHAIYKFISQLIIYYYYYYWMCGKSLRRTFRRTVSANWNCFWPACRCCCRKCNDHRSRFIIQIGDDCNSIPQCVYEHLLVTCIYIIYNKIFRKLQNTKKSHHRFVWARARTQARASGMLTPIDVVRVCVFARSPQLNPSPFTLYAMRTE